MLSAWGSHWANHLFAVIPDVTTLMTSFWWHYCPMIPSYCYMDSGMMERVSVCHLSVPNACNINMYRSFSLFCRSWFRISCKYTFESWHTDIGLSSHIHRIPTIRSSSWFITVNWHFSGETIMANNWYIHSYMVYGCQPDGPRASLVATKITYVLLYKYQ